MKRFLLWAFVLAGIIFGSCTSTEDEASEQVGSIYGIVTELGTAEPMKAMGVELYRDRFSALLLKTVTFDDGHFEFKDLKPMEYQVKVVADGYEQTEEGLVTVEAGRQARIDLQVKKQEVHAKAYTANATVSGSQVTLNGEYTKDYNYSVTEAGFVYATNNNPQNGGTKVKCKKDEIKEVNSAYKFSTTITDLSRGTYYYQAYATTSYGTAYGEILSFKISNPPVVTTLAPTNVLANTATLNGRIETEGEPAYTERGFVYSKLFNRPTVDDPEDATTKLPVSGRSKDFSANVSSLTENATYYVRAYAANGDETVYGEILTFTPSSILPSVTTLEVTNILQTSATLNGRIDNAGAPAYFEKGFVYSSSYQIPTIDDSGSATMKMVVDGVSSEFNANISSLKEGTTYYARAYATSSKGTSYGEVKAFKPSHPDYVVIDKLMVQKQDLSNGALWDSANMLCENSLIGGFSDWRLPTLSELSLLYNHKDEIGGFSNGIYWTSTYTGYNGGGYYAINFSNGGQNSYSTSLSPKHYVRAVRTVK